MELMDLANEFNKRHPQYGIDLCCKVAEFILKNDYRIFEFYRKLKEKSQTSFFLMVEEWLDLDFTSETKTLYKFCDNVSFFMLSLMKEIRDKDYAESKEIRRMIENLPETGKDKEVKEEVEAQARKIKQAWKEAKENGVEVIGDGVTIFKRYVNEEGKELECVAVIEP